MIGACFITAKIGIFITNNVDHRGYKMAFGHQRTCRDGLTGYN